MKPAQPAYIIADRIVYDLKTRDGGIQSEGYRSREQVEALRDEFESWDKPKEEKRLGRK